MSKEQAYSNNPCTEDDMQESIQDTVFVVSTAEHWHAINMFF
jgi:hypothetical protein